ncbi:uncharacterized protein C8orf76 homolog [Suncus etruscus]|uniref:uncharacterized protein C8orf76 homolog n=1 Tax=Suncus etruscus TaxID=109475 RepID=UPI0021109DAF|nr:uncharacterized protein C8orf76 homolog [Suncus etruscus]
METGCYLLGREFEDSVFEERPERLRNPPASYRAKHCEPQWFLDEVESCDDADTLTVKKFRGDLAYRQQDYQKALQEYSSIAEKLPSTNYAMRRDVQEGQARCLMQLGRQEEALEIALELENKATNTDHLTTVLCLQFAIWSSLQNVEKTILCLQKLISLHPFNPWNWSKLAEAYLTLRPALSASCEASQKQSKLSFSDQTTKSSSPHSADDCPSCSPPDLPTDSVLSVEASCGSSQQPAEAPKSPPDGVAVEREAMSLKTWLKACASFIRARLLLQLTQCQQTSFALERNLRTQQEIEEKVKTLGLREGPLLWMEEVMGEDIVPEKLRDEVQTEVKCVGSIALAAMVIASSKEFEDKWFSKVKDRFCPLENAFCTEIQILASEAFGK